MAWRGYVMKLTKSELIRTTNTTPRSYRLNPHNQQRCGFRREAKRPDTKKENVIQETKVSPSEASTPAPPPPPKAPRPTLFKPLMFTVGFTGCSFGAAAILQYETLKARVQTAKDEEESEKLLQGPQDMKYWHDWWKQLSGFQKQLILLMSMADDFWSSLTEGQRTVTGIIAVNAVVLCCWRIPAMQRSMVKYFTSNPASKTRYLPMVLSSFSHYSIIHMVTNMYVLWTFSSGIVSLLGKEQFLAVYLSAVGCCHGRTGCSLCEGARGQTRHNLPPHDHFYSRKWKRCKSVHEQNGQSPVCVSECALIGLVATDLVGLYFGWQLLDHAAHLGGALFGIWYVEYGHKLIWSKRQPLLKLWHDMRSPGGSRPGGGPGVSGAGAGGRGPGPQ
ncbi:presenilin-associated rhomboid-like protein A, mitochondrial isoform X2 [Centropristis striata]|uniref:presenilin-associated rhomboid-like protein A, mitochondrial isoform X2 n=1 Tax=Centropristis striata TaxID=184440 RepID=UPI0027E179A2|nr:presenilin-associated rhomboid-like protein A, mitochondrial isoform X2 [Centropristis striata]